MQGKLFLLILVLICFRGYSQKKWAGPITGNWDDPLNWQPAGVPDSSDVILLDNTWQPYDYQVSLSTGTVSVRSLALQPAPGCKILVTIPVANTSSPALIIHDNGNSFIIKEGGIFRNSSGLQAGQSIQTAGTIFIYNGGTYIHNTRSSHATEIVARLSSATGTEKGIFEFDVPGGSYPLSISNRVYGTMVLSSVASGGVQTYNASGSGQAVVNGDLQINDGVQFNLDLTNDFVINAGYLQKGGVFNLASRPNYNIIRIKGDITQWPGASISESSGGLPVLELCGNYSQQLLVAGNIINSVSLKVNNKEGIILIHSVTIPYKLEFKQGVITTSRQNILSLSDNCMVSGGSEFSFVNGPLSKTGDDDFEFPVGKQGTFAPVKISGTGGFSKDEFIAEYFTGNPELVYGASFESPPLVRISKLEYWALERSAGSSVKKVGLYVGNNSNASDLQSLSVIRWEPGKKLWKSEGNSSYSGIAIGNLASNDIHDFGAFTIGSTMEMQNPLPVHERQQAKSNNADNEVLTFRIGQHGMMHISSSRKQVLSIQITDLAGRRVRMLKHVVNAGDNTISIEWERLARGVYVIDLCDGSGRLIGVKRMMKL